MTISISTAQFAPKNKKAEVDGVVLTVRPQTSDFGIKALELQAKAKNLDQNDERIGEKARAYVDETREQMMGLFINREDAERVFANLDVDVIAKVYKEIIENGEDA